MKLAERLQDAVNPIVVKELRQALRGNYFSVSFWLAITVALVFAFTGVSRASGNPGPAILLPVAYAMAIACHGMIPLAAYLSMASEWNEGVSDLLLLSGLRPRQIVFGKLLSSLTQAVLVYSALLPFFGAAFLAGGVDLLVVGVLFGASLLTTTVTIAFSIGLGSLTRARAARVVTSLGLLLGLFVVTVGTAVFFQYLLGAPDALWMGDTIASLLVAIVIAVAAAIVSLGVAAVNFTHAGENRSTPLRVSVVVGGLATLAAPSLFGISMLDDFGAFVIVGVWISVHVAFLFFMTEPESLPKRVPLTVPRRAWLALLTAPFLPGGGRGMILFVLFGVAGTLILRIGIGGPIAPHLTLIDPVLGWYMLIATSAVWIAIPSVFFPAIVKTPRGLFRARLTLMLAHVGCVVLPGLIGVFLRDEDLMLSRHILNPFWAFKSAVKDCPPGFVVLAAAGFGFAVLVNLPRMEAGLLEVLRASRARRARFVTGEPAGDVATRT